MGGLFQVARDHPEDIFTEPMDIHEGATREKTLRLANRLGFHDDMAVQAAEQFERVYDFFLKADVTQVEINPLAETTDNRGESVVIAPVDYRLLRTCLILREG